MATDSLSALECEVLASLQFNAELTVESLARSTKTSASKVQWALKNLKERGLYRPWPLIDPYVLGFTEYEIFLSLYGESGQEKRKVLTFLAKHSKVVWWAEVIGPYDIIATVVCRNIGDITAFQAELSEKTAIKIKAKAVSGLASMTFIAKKYLSSQKQKIQTITFSSLAQSHLDLDALDKSLLAAACASGDFSQRELARNLGKPRSTVDFRLQRLRNLGVIKCFANRIDPMLFGFSKYRLLIALKGMPKQLPELLLNHSVKHQNVVNFFQCIGPHDFELTLECRNNRDVTAFVDNLYDHFGQHIESVQALSIVRHWNSERFLSDLK